MLVDGNKIATDELAVVTDRVKEMDKNPELVVVTCSPNFETQKFLGIKKRKADIAGVRVRVVELDPSATTDECVTTIKKVSEDADGVIVQLPFPEHIDREALINALPEEKDVDAFRGGSKDVLPPVVGAMKSIVEAHDVDLAGKKVVVIGNGRLVGKPAAKWFSGEGADVEILTKESIDVAASTKEADIVVLGAGQAHMLTPDMITDGVIILDAGTSEDAGELLGDADPACALKASLFTPVPGGIGPITVSILLKNLLHLASRR